MPYATTRDGARLYYEVSGRGPVVVAGSPFSATRSWPLPHSAARYRDALKDEYTVVLIDSIRGTGRSDRKYPPAFTPDIAASDLLAVADAAGIGRFAWLGFSWSSVVGIQLALRTDRLTALLCGGWSPIDGPYRETGQLAHKLGRTFPFRYLRRVRESMAMYQQIYAILANWSVEQQRRDIASITCPKLLYIGDKDNMQEPFRIARVSANMAAASIIPSFMAGAEANLAQAPGVLGDLPMTVVYADTLDVASWSEERKAEMRNAVKSDDEWNERMAQIEQANREVEKLSTRARRIAPPAGSTHSFPQEHPDFCVQLVREMFQQAGAPSEPR
jgi:pimeloyl-ACP methyl ester carboxylesterase